MKRKVEIVFEMTNNKGKIMLLRDGKEIPYLYGYEMNFDSRANVLKFTGKRLATNEYGQFFVDPVTKETALEEIDMLKFLSDEGTIRENANTLKKEVEFALKNVRDTSLLNARKMIQQRLG